MREHEQALEMAAARGFGRYTEFACPDNSPSRPGGSSWILFVPLAVVCGYDAPYLLRGLDDGHWWLRLPFVVLAMAVAVECVAMMFWLRHLRRPGGPTSRLYYFENGVVVATGRRLRPFGRQEFSIGSAAMEWQEPLDERDRESEVRADG
ncbi:hypothetical protein OHT57_44370 [Streptomyces sp. NBC_00285]|uniref:hypothetical protein n=1 Tax=Streptomyces sp. NBC_00285 TaxID=2975700 RepID=UPI002E2C9313|nr:hypothetical protein [Streptomyces sp. NBC_00285]